MTDRDQSTDMTPDETSDEEMRPLPDGGLASSMPDWLRRPPAWRDMSRTEDQGEQKELPEPDTSVIDPRTLVDIDDLPSWLQEMAARSSATSTTGAQAEIESATSGPGPSSTTHIESDTKTGAPTASEPAATQPAHATPTWIWAMRGVIILSLLLVIFYVFFL